MIAIVDYGAGNLFSLCSSLRFLDIEAEVTSDADKIRACDRIIVPGVGAFGDAHRSHTLWAGLERSERLNVLAGRCRSAGERAGVPPEKREYRPHVTLAYLKPQANPDRIGAWITGHNLLKSPPIRVDRFGLYSSVLTGDGSVYTLEREYLL